MMKSLFNMVNYVLNMMNDVFKMMNYVIGNDEFLC